MFGIPPNYLVAGALLVIGLVGFFWNRLPSLSNLTSLIPSRKPVKPTRFDTIGLLDKAFEFCEDAEYRTAIKAAITHLYDNHAGQQ